MKTIQMSINGSINKMCYIHKMKCYSTVEMNAALIGAAVWMSLEYIMQNERNQIQKLTRGMTPFI